MLSDHTSALTNDANKVAYMSGLSLERHLLLLSEVYAEELTTRIHVIKKTNVFPTLTQYQI